MNYKKLEDWNSGMHDKILRRHPNGFTGAVIQGERGMGKSTYAYKVMAKLYLTLGEYRSQETGQITYVNNEDDAYKAALEHMIFSPDQLIRLIKYNIANDYITPVICLDDATVHFNSYKFFVDLDEVILLKGMFDTIRTALTGLLMTCPKRRNLLSFLRDYDDLKIEIKMAPGMNHDRLARCYQFNYYPDDRKYKVIIPFQDKYSCYIPDKHFKPYMEKRKEYLELINDKIERIMEEKEKRKKNKSFNPDALPV